VCDRRIVSVRDLLAWVEFICHTTKDTEPEVTSASRSTQRLDLSSAYVHGACIVFVDALVNSGDHANPITLHFIYIESSSSSAVDCDILACDSKCKDKHQNNRKIHL